MIIVILVKVFHLVFSHRVALLLGGLVALYCLLLAFSMFLEPQSTVKNFKISNITDHQITLSWTTDKATKGSVVASSGSLPRIPFRVKQYTDDGESSLKKKLRYTTHHVTVGNLKPNTKYNFKIFQGIRGVYSAKATTGPTLKTFISPNPVYGRILQKQGKPAVGVIVYLMVVSDKSSSALLSTLTNSKGRWSLDLGNLRGTDLNAFSNSEGAEVIFIASKDKSTWAETEAGKDKPWPDVIIDN